MSGARPASGLRSGQHGMKRPTKTATSEADEEPRVDGRHLRRLRTEQRLVSAVGELLRESGVAALGVNAVAERAGVEKVLVYRYYGGLDGLMEAYADVSDFWPTLEELVGKKGEVLRDPDKARAGTRVLANYAAALRKRPVTLDLLAWECAHRNALTVALEKVREERSTELAEALTAAGVIPSEAAATIGTLFAAAINYLAVRGRELSVFGGVGVRTSKDWARIEEAIYVALRALARDTVHAD